MTLRTSTSTPTITNTTPATDQHRVTLLILGAGWTYQFLHPLLSCSNITHAATTTTGRDGTRRFQFDPDSDDPTPFQALPRADYVLITFPLKGRGPSAKLLSLYAETHPQSRTRAEGTATTTTAPTDSTTIDSTTKWIQLGSTGIYTAPGWSDSDSPVDGSNERGVAEAELIGLGGCVLNLAGLYGGGREPRNWVVRVAKTKDMLAAKGALHLIHGKDVARAVVAVLTADGQANTGGGEGLGVGGKGSLFGRRWIVADCVSYDWWSVVWDCMGESDNRNHSHRPSEAREGGGDENRVKDEEDTAKAKANAEERSKYRRWIFELMQEQNVRCLPRSLDLLGRKLDAREFWQRVRLLPERTLAR